MTIGVIIAEVEVLQTILLTQEVTIAADLLRSTGALHQVIIGLTTADLTIIAEALVAAIAGQATQGLMGIPQADLQAIAEAAALTDRVEARLDLQG